MCAIVEPNKLSVFVIYEELPVGNCTNLLIATMNSMNSICSLLDRFIVALKLPQHFSCMLVVFCLAITSCDSHGTQKVIFSDSS